MTLYDGPGETLMPSDPIALYAETPVLIDALAAAVGTTPQDVLDHLTESFTRDKLDDATALHVFIDEYVLTE